VRAVRQAVLGLALVLDIVAKRLRKRQPLLPLECGSTCRLGAQSRIFGFRSINARASQGSNASGFGTCSGQLQLPWALTILLRKPILALDVRPLNGVAHQQGSLAVGSNAKLQASVERELVGPRFGFVGFNRSDCEERHLRAPCPTGVRKILSSNVTQLDCMKQNIPVTH
jgi:hypothetical protein